MIEPILPMFITLLGGDSRIIGLIGGFRDSISSILKVLAGYLSDKFGKRKPFVFWGYFTSSIFKLLLGLAKLPGLAFTFASLERTGKGLRTAPRDAILSDSMPKHSGKGFGIHRFFDSLGSVFGALIVFFMLWHFNLGYSFIIVVSAFIGLFALVPLLFVKEVGSKHRKMNFIITIKEIPHNLKLFIFVASVFSLANISYMFFILRVQDLLTDEFLKKTVPVLFYILFNIFYATLAIPFGKLSDKVGKPSVLIAGYLVFSVMTFGFASFSSLYVFIVLFALYGLSMAMINSNQRAFVGDLSKKYKATALGTYHTIVGILAFFSSTIAGFLYHINPGYAFYYSSILTCLSAIMLLYFKVKKVWA